MDDKRQKPTVPPKPLPDCRERASDADRGCPLSRDAADLDLDSLLIELSALEDQLNSSQDGQNLFSAPPPAAETDHERSKLPVHRHDDDFDSELVRSQIYTAGNPQRLVVSAREPPRTGSPDNDSAFCDSRSFTSSESVLSGVARSNLSRRSILFADRNAVQNECAVESATTSTGDAKSSASEWNCETESAEERRKAEKIKLALERMREARVKKLYVKFSRVDGDAKSLLVDERWTAGRVLRLLAGEFGTAYCVNHALVESCPELHLDRMYEDHELLVENILLWSRESTNAFYFVERVDKYGLFYDPQVYLLRESASSNSTTSLDAAAKHRLIADFFAAPQLQVAETKGVLYIKSDGKKSWKKFYCTLRSSGLYFCPKGKAKTPKDLVCLSRTETVNIYKGADWRKKYKAPTDFGFALKHPKIQAKASKYIKYFCVDDEETLNRWTASFRLVKYGKQLYENFAECCDYLPSGSEECASRKEPSAPKTVFGAASPGINAERSGGRDEAATFSSFELDFSARGTIKRRPARGRRADSPSFCSDSASLSAPAVDSADEAESDSDEDSASAALADSPSFPAPPPVVDPPQQPQRRPEASNEAPRRRAPPAPPKRSENTRLSVVSIPSSVLSEEVALERTSPVRTIGPPSPVRAGAAVAGERPKPPVPAKPVVVAAREQSAPAASRKSPSASADFRSELREALQRRMDKVEAAAPAI